MPSDHNIPAQWSVYLVRCRSGALYTGITTDVSRRIKEHRDGQGAKYLRGKGPLHLVFKKKIGAKGLALSVEGYIKKLSKARKESLIKQNALIEQIITEAMKTSRSRTKRSAELSSSLNDRAMDILTLREARRLALARSGLLKPTWTGFPERVKGREKSVKNAAVAVIKRFGYLQLDTVSIAGARSHTIVLLSRLKGFDHTLGEQLLQPGTPLFEYWGHEASWMPIELYPAFEFRRREFRHHPWWGDVLGEHPVVARNLCRRIRDEGPLRSVDMEGKGSSGWWDLKVAKRVATALWSSGELAIRERKRFQRTYDLAERVIPEAVLGKPLTKRDGLDVLLLKALDGHGWATTGTIASTWRLKNHRQDIVASLKRLVEQGKIMPCALENPGGRATSGWITLEDRELVDRLDSVRPRCDRGVLLSPFDPLLWDRTRVQRLFEFSQVLEIFKPSAKRIYGYYCLPVLAGERLIARFDLKADRKRGVLHVLSCRFEGTENARPASAQYCEAARTALSRYGDALELKPTGWHLA